MKRTMIVVLSALALVLAGCSATAEGTAGGKVGGGVQNPIAPAK